LSKGDYEGTLRFDTTAFVNGTIVVSILTNSVLTPRSTSFCIFITFVEHSGKKITLKFKYWIIVVPSIIAFIWNAIGVGVTRC